MKKGKLLVVGLISLLMACSLIFFGCPKEEEDDDGCAGDGKCYSDASGYGDDCKDDCIEKRAQKLSEPQRLSCNC